MGFGWIKENPHQISNVIWAFSKCFLFNVGEGVSLKLQVSLGTLPPIHQKLWSTICYYQWQVFIEHFFSMEDTLRSLSSTIRLRYRQQKEITIQDRKLSGSGKQCAVFLKRRKLPLSRKNIDKCSKETQFRTSHQMLLWKVDEESSEFSEHK